jgi:pimeloyl-ACP methyl ester carboxylesterase
MVESGENKMNQRQPPGSLVQVHGMTIHYEEFGDRVNPTLLLVHGGWASSLVWHAAIPLLNGFHIVAIDLPCHGFSSRETTFSMAINDQAEVVADFLMALGIDRAHVVGQSMGGAVSLALAARYPEKINKLTLVDAHSYPFPLSIRARLVLTPVIGRFILNRLYDHGQVAAFLRRDVYFDSGLVTDAEIDSMYQHFDENRMIALTTLQAIDDDAWLADTICNVMAPTLVIWGSEDRLIPLSNGQRLHANIPDSRFVVIEQCGHAPMSEKPGEFCSVLSEFLISDKENNVTHDASHGISG